MYISRRISDVFKKTLNSFPSILITGPRQSGKTTFLLHELKKTSDYVSFDDPLERDFALRDPNGFLNRFTKKHVIMDEIQYVPHLFSYLKILIDKHRSKNGRWILTGSQQFQIMKHVSESLAGRIAILELLPFNMEETSRIDKKHKNKKNWLENRIINGSYPEPYIHPQKSDIWIRSYIQTYLERDVRQLQNIKDIGTFQSFLGLAAALHSQLFNSATFSRKIGMSLPTIKSWMSILSASYLCYFLYPWFKNYGKRLIKTPKFYFLDSAIVCALTRQPDAHSSIYGSMGGALFEGFIVSETVKVFTSKGQRPNIFFWRSHDGLEVDMLIHTRGKIYPVEIKLSSTLNPNYTQSIQKFKTLAGSDSADTGIVVCRVDKKINLPFNNIAIPWQHFSHWLSTLIL